LKSTTLTTISTQVAFLSS